MVILGSENNSAVTTRGCYKSDKENAHVLNNYDEEIRLRPKKIFKNEF